MSISLLVACGNSQKNSEKASQEVQTEKSSTSEAKNENKSTYSIGDTITFDNYAEYTITNVEWTDERNEFDNTNPDKVLKVTYNVKNLSDKDMPIGIDINLFVGGNKMESYANDHTMGSITPGRSIEGAVEHFGVKGEGDLELEIKPFAALGEKPAIISIDVK
ncbi:DUF4352 domain-containing protein [Streptococcus australis]|nr:DUF4352 domain-containing protein [Streptococcus australis]